MPALRQAVRVFRRRLATMCPFDGRPPVRHDRSQLRLRRRARSPDGVHPSRAPELAGQALLVEDLSSANGVFVDGQRVRSARVRPGAEIRCGAVALPWSHEGLRGLLRAGATTGRSPCRSSGVARTCAGPAGTSGSSRRARRRRSSPATSARRRCACDRPTGGAAAARWRSRRLCSCWPRSGAACGGCGCGRPCRRAPTRPSCPSRCPHGSSLPPSPPARDDGAEDREGVRSDGLRHPQCGGAPGARSQGPFHVEQVAEIWTAVRREWRYVNDPRGRDYFASARETIDNGYVGDCDDFAIVLASMVTAVGGEARHRAHVGPAGRHAYAEALRRGEPQQVAPRARPSLPSALAPVPRRCRDPRAIS